MLDKIRAIGEYIKNNNVGDDLKQRFTNVLQGYKTKLAAKSASEGPHKKIMGKLSEFKKKAPMKGYEGRPASADVRENKIMKQRESEDERGERMDDVRMMRQRDQEDYNQRALNQF